MSSFLKSDVISNGRFSQEPLQDFTGSASAGIDGQEKNSRQMTDEEILAHAKKTALQNASELVLKADDLDEFDIDIETERSTDGEENRHFIFELHRRKIIASFPVEKVPEVVAFDGGRPCRISGETRSLILNHVEKVERVKTVDRLPDAPLPQPAGGVTVEFYKAESAAPSRHSQAEHSVDPDRQRKLAALTDRLSRAYTENEVLSLLSEIQLMSKSCSDPESGAPLSVPAYDEACLSCYRRGLEKSGFVDELDEDVLKLGLSAGLEERRVRQEMADKAVHLFLHDLSPSSNAPLKISRARKIREFGSTIGLDFIKASPTFHAFRHTVEEILEMPAASHGAGKQEVTQMYMDMLQWIR